MRTIAIALFSLAGCIDEFRGSNIQIDFKETMPVQASAFTPQRPDELPNNIHFTLYAFDEGMDSSGNPVSRLFEVQKFEVHRIVDLASPCFIDVGEHVPIPGLHVSKYAEEVGKLVGVEDITNPPPGASEQDKIDAATAVQRQVNVGLMASAAGPKAIVAASPGGYGPVASSCSDTNGIPPPECVDAASNQRRLEMCSAEWERDEALFEGTDRVLTAPLNGTTYGFVLGNNPVNGAFIGGAGFFVEESLSDFDGFALYWQYDDADNDGTPDYPPTVPSSEQTPLGKLFMFGRPETGITRGVIRTRMTNIESPLITADLVIFADIGDDDVHF